MVCVLESIKVKSHQVYRSQDWVVHGSLLLEYTILAYYLAAEPGRGPLRHLATTRFENCQVPSKVIGLNTDYDQGPKDDSYVLKPRWLLLAGII